MKQAYGTGPHSGNSEYASLSSLAMIESRDIAVWVASAVLAIGIGWSRYAKAKSRNDLVRSFAAMNPEQRKKMISRLNPQMAMEVRQELLERFGILV
jgi:hypothetical protein